MEEIIFRFMDTVRDHTIKKVKEIPENKADIIPRGFNNNIRWNIGHLLFVQDRLVFSLLGKPMGIPKYYKFLFAPGTKPADWQFPAPSIEDLVKELESQKDRIRGYLTGRLNEKLDEPFTSGLGLTFYTVGAALQFTFYHEGIHMEDIKRIKIGRASCRERE